MKALCTLVMIALMTAQVMAEKPTDKEILEATFQLGGDWAVRLLKKEPQDEKVVEALKRLNRILPYGRTLNGVRTESQIFRIEMNKDRIIALYPTATNFKIIFGGHVEPHWLNVGNSAELLFGPGPGKEKFIEAFEMVVDANKRFEQKYGASALVKGEDPFNREVQLLGTRMAMDLNLSPDLVSKPQQLGEFMLMILEVSCDRLLGSFK